MVVLVYLLHQLYLEDTWPRSLVVVQLVVHFFRTLEEGHGSSTLHREMSLAGSHGGVHSEAFDSVLHDRSQSRMSSEVGLQLFSVILALDRTCPFRTSHQSKIGESFDEISELAPSCFLFDLLTSSLPLAFVDLSGSSCLTGHGRRMTQHYRFGVWIVSFGSWRTFSSWRHPWDWRSLSHQLAV